MKAFSINAIKFTGKFEKQITKGLIEEYSHIYTNVTIEYKPISNMWRFIVYADVFMLKPDKTRYMSQTEITRYTNTEAINFSDISIEEYYNEYDYSKKDYLEQFINEVEALFLMYNLEGFKLDRSKHGLFVYEKYFDIILPSSNNWSTIKFFRKDFRFPNMLIKSEKTTYIREVKKFLSDHIKDGKVV